MCPGVRSEAWLGRFTHSFDDAECSGHAQYPIFPPDTLFLLHVLQKMAVGFLVSLYLFHKWPHLGMDAAIFSHLGCLFILLLPCPVAYTAEKSQTIFSPKIISALIRGKIDILTSGKECILKITLLWLLFIFLTFRHNFLNQFYF